MSAQRSPGTAGQPRLRPGRRLLAVVLLACLLLGSAGGLMVVQSRDEMRGTVMTAMDVRAQFAATEAYGSRLGVIRLLQGVGGDTAIRSARPEAIRQRLAGIDADALGLTGGLVWLDRSGTVRVSTRTPAGGRAGGTWWSEALRSGGWTTSGATITSAFTGEVLVFAVATRDDSGAVNGVLAAGWGVEWLRRTAQRHARETAATLYGSGTDLLIVDRTGHLVVGDGVRVTRDVGDSELYRRIAALPEPFAHGAWVESRGLSGRHGQLVAFCRMGPFGELVVLERPTRVAFAAPSGAARARVAQLGLIVLLALIGAGLAARRIDRLTRERDELHHAEHEIVVGVQRSLLTTSLPDGVTVRYLPAPSALNVGGDWYDAIPLPDGRLFLVVGDVVGHGVAAALAMGQIRTAARALAPRAGGPAELLAELSGYVASMPNVGFCTAACVLIAPDDPPGTVRYALAGHPPPLVRHPDGHVVRLAARPAAPLGLVEGDAISDSVATVPDGLVILYTDGLVERRSELIDDGIDRLADAVGVHDPADGDWAEAVIAQALGDDHRTDDLALLACRLTAERDGPGPAAPPGRTTEPPASAGGGGDGSSN